jgi:hypothetical protein
VYLILAPLFISYFYTFTLVPPIPASLPHSSVYHS